MALTRSRVPRSRARARVALVANRLERFLGTPRQSGRLPAPLDMLVATILSQNTSDVNSHRAYTALRTHLPTWEAVAEAPESRVRALIRVGGMANQKAARIHEVLRTLKKQYGSYRLNALRRKSNDEIIETLTRLDGVGVKTASCVLVFSLGRDVFPVDTHVHRVCNRLGLVSDCPTPEKTFVAMKELVPSGKAYSLHTNMIRFGRLICKASRPACDRCPVFDLCRWPERGTRRGRRTVPTKSRYDFMLLDNIPA